MSRPWSKDLFDWEDFDGKVYPEDPPIPEDTQSPKARSVVKEEPRRPPLSAPIDKAGSASMNYWISWGNIDG
jgi:hypothetical protein